MRKLMLRNSGCAYSGHFPGYRIFNESEKLRIIFRGLLKYLLILTVFFIPLNSAVSQEKIISFGKQNKNTKYKSVSGGMRLSYGNNPSFLKYVQYELPDYFRVPESQQIPDFEVGYEFFGGFEYQLAKNFSLKADYSYFIKSLNSTAPQYSAYDFSYYNHNILLTGYYLIPGEYFYLKFGAGTGLILSSLSTQTFGLTGKYNSTGINTKLEGVLNTQISNSIAAYFSVFLSGTFNGSLKNSDGSLLKTRPGDEVNLNSFNVGLGLGFEYFIF